MTTLHDEQAIRDLAAAYTDAVNRRSGEDMAKVYAPDGVLLPEGGRPLEGMDLLTRAFKRLVERDREFLFQMTHSSVVEVSGDRAQARFWFSEIKKPTGEGYLYVLGVYQDEAVRLAEGWRFSRREPRGLFQWKLPPEGLSHTALASLPPFLPITGLPRP